MASALSVEDIKLLEKTISIRERLIDTIVAKELPTSARDIDCFTNLLESVDRSIFSKAKINLEESSNKVNEATNQVLKELIVELHKTPTNVSANRTEVPVFSSTGKQVSDGELIRKIDQIDVNEALGGK